MMVIDGLTELFDYIVFFFIILKACKTKKISRLEQSLKIKIIRYYQKAKKYIRELQFLDHVVSTTSVLEWKT